jgi:hypothetical protein
VTSVLNIDKPHKDGTMESESEITMCDRMQMYNKRKSVRNQTNMLYYLTCISECVQDHSLEGCEACSMVDMCRRFGGSCCLLLPPWRWRQYVSPKHLQICPSTVLYSSKSIITSHKAIDSFTNLYNISLVSHSILTVPRTRTYFFWSMRSCLALLMVPWGFNGPFPGTGIIEESPSIRRWLLESLENAHIRSQTCM